MKTKTLLPALLIVLAVIACEKENIVEPDQSQAEEIATRAGGPPGQNPPVANAGADQVIILPINTVSLNGSATDPDNNIRSYQWTKVAGPSSCKIVSPKSAQTQVTDLVEGTYRFELKVTDKTNLFDRDTVQVTVNAPIPLPPCITNCGKIVFVSNRDGNYEIYSCNADGSNITRLTNTPADYEAWPAWSPDGTRIAFTSGANLFIMNADGSNVVQKTFANVGALNPAWSPDGSRIAFSDGGAIMIIDLANDTISYVPNAVTASDYISPTPAWSPDGAKIAFESDMIYPNFYYGASDIFTVSPDGSGLTNLTPQPWHNDYVYIFPSWSTNGTKLSVTLLQFPSQNSIAVMNADGTGLTIIKTIETVYTPTRTSWSPDGTHIAYTDNNNIKWVASNGSASGIIITNGWDADWKH